MLLRVLPSLAVGLFLAPARTLQSAVPAFSFSFNSLSFFVGHRILTFFQTVQLLLCITFFTLTAALRPWSHMFACDTRAAHCPCQLKTRPVSSRHTPTCPWCTHRCSRPARGLCRLDCFKCADSFHPAPRHCQLARPFSLRSNASQSLHA